MLDIERLLAGPGLAPAPEMLDPAERGDLLKDLLTAAGEVGHLPSVVVYVKRAHPRFRHQFTLFAWPAYRYDDDWRRTAIGPEGTGGPLSSLLDELELVEVQGFDPEGRLAEHWRRRGFPFAPPLEAVAAWAAEVDDPDVLLREVGADTPVLAADRSGGRPWRRREDAPWVAEATLVDRIEAKHQAIAAACPEPEALLDRIWDHDPMAVVGLFQNPHLTLEKKRTIRDTLIDRIQRLLDPEPPDGQFHLVSGSQANRLLAEWDALVEPLPTPFREELAEASLVEGRLGHDHSSRAAASVIRGRFAWNLYASLTHVPEGELKGLYERLMIEDAPLQTFVTHPRLSRRLKRRVLEDGASETTAVALAHANETAENEALWSHFRALEYPTTHRMLVLLADEPAKLRALWRELVELDVIDAGMALRTLDEERTGWLRREDLVPVLASDNAFFRETAFERLDQIDVASDPAR